MDQELIAAAGKIILHGPRELCNSVNQERLYYEPRTLVIILEHMENSLLTLYLVRPRTENCAICYAISNIPLETTWYYLILG